MFFKKFTNITTFHYHISSFINICSLSSISWNTKFFEIVIFFTIFLIILTSSFRFFDVFSRNKYVFFHSFESFSFFHLYISLKMWGYFTIFKNIIFFYRFYPFSSLKNSRFIIIFIPITFNNCFFR